MYTLGRTIRTAALAAALGVQSLFGPVGCAEEKVNVSSPSVEDLASVFDSQGSASRPAVASGAAVPGYSRSSAATSQRVTAPAAAVPHYLENIIGSIPDRIDRMEYKWKLTASLSRKYGNDFSRADFMSLALRGKAKIAGQEVEMIFKDYRIEQKEGKPAIAYYTNSDREFLTSAQFVAVANDMAEVLARSVDIAYANHQGHEDLIVNGLADLLRSEGRLGPSEDIKALLDKVVAPATAAAPAVTMRQALYLPRIAKGDFVPKRFIVGRLSDGVLGMCYLDSGWVFYEPMARVWDHVDGAPTVLVHELEHRNASLQGIPFAFRFNAETLAEVAVMAEVDPFTMIFHDYLRDVRHLSKVLFGLDTARIARESFFFTEGGVEIDRPVLSRYVTLMDKAAKEVKQEVLSSVIPEFWRHFGFWSALDQKYHDDNQALKGWFYLNYDPTSLGGVVNTRKRLAKLEPVISEAWEEAKENLSEKTSQDHRGPMRVPPGLEAEVSRFLSAWSKEAGGQVRVGSEDAMRLFGILQRLGLIDESARSFVKREGGDGL